MASWLARILIRIRELAGNGQVRLTYKAEREAEMVGLAPEDVLDVLMGLRGKDSVARLVSRRTSEWMYAFKPEVGGEILYIKVVVRSSCIVVSFHEDENESEEDE